MKSFALKVSAAAIGVAIGGSAFAGWDATTSSALPSGSLGLAKELNYVTSTISSSPAQLTDIKTLLGFGVSAGQTRFIRIDLVGATLASAASNGDVTGFTGTTGTAGNTAGGTLVTVAQGGTVGASFVIYQITAGSPVGEPQDQAITIRLPSLHTTSASNSAAVTATYGLYNDAPAAAAGNSSAALNPNKSSFNLLTFADGLVFSTTAFAAPVASVAKGYHEFVPAAASGGVPETTATLAPLGKITFGTAPNVKNGSGTQVSLADLISASSIQISDGVFTANGAQLYLGDTTGASQEPITLNGGATGGTTANLGTDPLVDGFDNILWYKISAGNTVEIPKVPSIKAALSVTPQSASSAAAQGPAKVGEITQDGTKLTTPLFQLNSGFASRFVLSNTSGVEANWTAQVIVGGKVYNNGTETTDSQTFTPVRLTGKIPANSYVIIGGAELGTFTGTQRGSIMFTVDRPRSDINGVWQYQPTGGSLSNTLLVTPGTN